jgi:glyoxylase-like metal-dependent hydrolase (beta-lactamase superfamily II)
VDDQFDLSDYGVAGRIVHTPGHSASSISIALDSGEALIGDMVREEKGSEIGLGAFYEDKQLLIESLEKVAALEPRTISRTAIPSTTTPSERRLQRAEKGKNGEHLKSDRSARRSRRGHPSSRYLRDQAAFFVPCLLV